MVLEATVKKLTDNKIHLAMFLRGLDTAQLYISFYSGGACVFDRHTLEESRILHKARRYPTNIPEGIRRELTQFSGHTYAVNERNGALSLNSEMREHLPDNFAGFKVCRHKDLITLEYVQEAE